MSSLELRPATSADIPLLLSLILASFEEMRGRLDPPSGAHGETESTLQDLFDSDEEAALASLDGEAVGCVFYSRTGAETYAHRLAVLPEYRHAAVGRTLMAYVEAQATQEGCAYVRVGVRLALPGNLAFFERLGYKAIAEDRHPGYPGPTFAHMVKEMDHQMMRVVQVVPYDPVWPEKFAREATAVREAMGDTVITIEHVGSTSVPGLAAKPIIDMMPLVHNVDDLGKCIRAMAAIGYIPRGEFGLPGRRYFVKGTPHARVVHCHAYAADHPEVTRHLAFRDYLRTHPDARNAYAELKIELAQRYPSDIVAYMDGKDGLIKELEAKALDWYPSKGA